MVNPLQFTFCCRDCGREFATAEADSLETREAMEQDRKSICCPKCADQGLAIVLNSAKDLGVDIDALLKEAVA